MTKGIFHDFFAGWISGEKRVIRPRSVVDFKEGVLGVEVPFCLKKLLNSFKMWAKLVNNSLEPPSPLKVLQIKYLG